MCGIVAFASWAAPVEPDRIGKGMAALRHRGPDGAGSWTSPDGRVALGHTRLALVDRAGGAQPLSNETGDIVVVASDHGEGLGEHGEQTHGALCYGATADVFLAVRAPGFLPGTTDEGQRSLCDLAPSIRAWAGLAPQASDGVAIGGGVGGRVVVTESLQDYRTYAWAQVFSATTVLTPAV